MKPRKKHPRKPRKRTSSDAQPEPEAPRPARVEWSEPAEPERPERYDIERDDVPPEVGCDEPEIDWRPEHGRERFASRP